MKIYNSTTFSTLNSNYQTKNSTTNTKATDISGELDKTANKYSDGSWKDQPVKSHYRNTFVEQQKQNYLKRINLV